MLSTGQARHLGIGVGVEAIDGDDDGYAMVGDVTDVREQIGRPVGGTGLG